MHHPVAIRNRLEDRLLCQPGLALDFFESRRVKRDVSWHASTTIDKMEARPGGEWRFVQRDKAGNEFAFRGVYHEVKGPERTVQTFEFEGMPGHVALDTATFEEIEGKTRLTQQSVFQSVADRDGMVQSGMEKGATESMDRLAELLAELLKEKRPL